MSTTEPVKKKSRDECVVGFFERPSPKYGGLIVAVIGVICAVIFKIYGIGWLSSMSIAAMGLVAHIAGVMGKNIPKEDPVDERASQYWSILFWSTLALLAFFFLALCGIAFRWP